MYQTSAFGLWLQLSARIWVLGFNPQRNTKRHLSLLWQGIPEHTAGWGRGRCTHHQSLGEAHSQLLCSEDTGPFPWVLACSYLFLFVICLQPQVGAEIWGRGEDGLAGCSPRQDWHASSHRGLSSWDVDEWDSRSRWGTLWVCKVSHPLSPRTCLAGVLVMELKGSSDCIFSILSPVPIWRV